MRAKKKQPRRKPAASPTEATEPARAPSPSDFPIVGMVASAGGLEAFKKFFSAMPSDHAGLAFVLVPHLDPTHDSLMVELLAKYTTLSVTEAVEGTCIAPDHIYVIPPNNYLVVEQGKLRLTEQVERDHAQTAIDRFLRSLAADRQEKAIGIVLSGTGAHGTLGLKAVKAAGGMTMVQDPRTASFDSMPQNAIATGLADFVLAPEAMPAALIHFVRQAHAPEGQPSAAESNADMVEQVLALIRARSKYDFRCYRKKMATRRIERRRSLLQLPDLPHYLTYLHEHPEEVKHLVKDLLISVTSFFRDPEAYQALQAQAIAPLLQHKKPHAPLRVWVPGCATGEEAYSIGMLLLEQLAAAQKHCPVQIFATDLDEDALNVARQGVYAESIAADVSAERLERFFTRAEEQTYQVAKELRETVVFAVQNVVSDAPFSKLDLISCRNLFIYLEPAAQQQLLRLFHFALAPGGFLLLGPSESDGAEAGLFEPVSKQWRLFRRAGASHERRAEPAGAHRSAGRDGDAWPKAPHGARIVSYADLTQRALLEEFAPAAVLVNAKQEIVYLQGATARYLNLPSGEPALNVVEMVRAGLRTKLRSALAHAGKTREMCVATGLRLKRPEGYAPLKLTVKPVKGHHTGADLFLVVFEETAASAGPQPAAAEQVVEESQVRQLEYELKTSREELHAVIEQLETANEEMKAANEEMTSMNEELQSANEELETSKEELQSLNEELSTVNSQLQEKVQEVEETNNDLANLLNTTDLATIFLDGRGRIKRFTPASRRLFNLIDADVGRPIGDVTQKFTDADLLHDVEAVLRDADPVEKEVCTADGRWYTRRLLPYRTLNGRIEGVVLTFADVTILKRAELALRQDKELRRLAAVLMDSNDAILVHDFQGKITAWNSAAVRMYGYTETEALGMNIAKIIPEDGREQSQALMEWVRRHSRSGPHEMSRRSKSGALLAVSLSATLLRDEAGAPIAVVTTERDVSQHKHLEKEVLEIATLEQRRIGQELHDNIGQELTGLALVAGSLAEALQAAASPEAALAGKVAAGVKGVLGHMRALSRGLIPVEVDGHGLASALQNLAARISDLQQIPCTFEQEGTVLLQDHQAATHLYRIAQEAVANALKHSRAKHITLRLGLNEGRVALRIRDDGVGIPEKLPEGPGMGLRIMRYRADLNHARLDIEPAPYGGTQVTCTLPKEMSHA